MWYAHHPGRRTRQLVGDGTALLWTGLCAGGALTAHRALVSASRHAVTVHRPRLPLLGPGPHSGPLHDMARAGGRIAHAAPGGQGAAQVLAWLAALVLFAVPVGLMLVVWLPRRLRWSRQAVAARDLAATEDGRELLALRTLMRPLDEVGRTAEALSGSTPGSLAEGWREGDPDTLDALAEAELVRLGLRTG
ncbi:hypothetical protein [Streptomyces beihaiensis]|uniref:Uncharacterized protein n=1 Tax=Streptomyces beihaiensis TaxID=2984495 RepID=A0ABT3TQ14_9ACTN|nr:hypothetical protein [Streptomyces beihaiensis]MCX3059129.1 hypothetical protein [Streptomyces beihaiensis]